MHIAMQFRALLTQLTCNPQQVCQFQELSRLFIVGWHLCQTVLDETESIGTQTHCWKQNWFRDCTNELDCCAPAKTTQGRRSAEEYKNTNTNWKPAQSCLHADPQLYLQTESENNAAGYPAPIIRKSSYEGSKKRKTDLNENFFVSCFHIHCF